MVVIARQRYTQGWHTAQKYSCKSRWYNQTKQIFNLKYPSGEKKFLNEYTHSNRSSSAYKPIRISPCTLQPCTSNFVRSMLC